LTHDNRPFFAPEGPSVNSRGWKPPETKPPHLNSSSSRIASPARGDRSSRSINGSPRVRQSSRRRTPSPALPTRAEGAKPFWVAPCLVTQGRNATRHWVEPAAGLTLETSSATPAIHLDERGSSVCGRNWPAVIPFPFLLPPPLWGGLGRGFLISATASRSHKRSARHAIVTYDRGPSKALEIEEMGVSRSAFRGLLRSSY